MVDVKEIVWLPFPTVKLVNADAATYCTVPTWSALTLHDPAALNVTNPVAALYAQLVVVVLSIDIVIGSAPRFDVALGVYPVPCTTAPTGGADMVSTCVPLLTVMECCTCGAGLNAAFPAWLKLTRHVPVFWYETTDPAS
jgi:hypothetical protein